MSNAKNSIPVFHFEPVYVANFFHRYSVGGSSKKMNLFNGVVYCNKDR